LVRLAARGCYFVGGRGKQLLRMLTAHSHPLRKLTWVQAVGIGGREHLAKLWLKFRPVVVNKSGSPLQPLQ